MIPKVVSSFWNFKHSTAFRRRLVIGYVITLILSAIIAAASISLMRSIARNKDLVIYDYAQDLILTEKLREASQKKIATYRAYLITKSKIYLDEIPHARQKFTDN